MSKLIKRKPENGMYRRKGYSAYRKGKSMATHTMAKIAYKGYKLLKNMVNAEKHYIDTSITNATPGTAGSVYGLVSCSQGDTDVTRNGDSIKLDRITLKGSININSASAYDYVRIALVCDKENQGTAPGWTDIFEEAQPLTYLNNKNMSRFVVIKTWLVPLNLAAAYNVIINFSKKLDFHVKYDGNAGTTADYRSNALFLVFNGGDNANKANFTWRTRVSFYDN